MTRNSPQHSRPEPTDEIEQNGFGPELVAMIDQLVETAAKAAPGTHASHRRTALVEDLVRTSLRILEDGSDLGQVKVMERALREMRTAYRVFNRWKGVRKISIFGSARTPETHPDYTAAREFGRLMAAEGWMAITGAGMGIMKAGHEGPSRESSFGLSIRLPFETNANDIIKGDAKLISFKYFFTREQIGRAHV